jgi:hypothetical protein
MRVHELNDTVRVAVPDATDPDAHYHGRVGRVVAVRLSPLSEQTGDPRDLYLYRVAFDRRGTDEMLFRHDDLAQVQDSSPS